MLTQLKSTASLSIPIVSLSWLRDQLIRYVCLELETYLFSFWCVNVDVYVGYFNKKNVLMCFFLDCCSMGLEEPKTEVALL